MAEDNISIATKLKYLPMDYPDEVKSDKWTVLYFDVNGRTFSCKDDIFAFESDAKHYALWVTDLTDEEEFSDDADTWVLDNRTFSHFILMPVK